MDAHLGPLAAAATALCWSVTGMFFGAAGRRVGSFSVNQIRLIFALLLLGGAHLALYGVPWPSADAPRLTRLAISGLIGLAIGDACLFQAFVVLGVRNSTLMMTLWPAMATGLAWPLLGERPGAGVPVGMGVTLAGVFVAVASRRGQASDVDPAPTLAGLALGFFGALGQAAGMVVAKPALADGFSPLSGTIVRMAAAAAALWAIGAVRAPKTAAALRNGGAMGLTLGGAFCGPFLGVTLSLLAVQRTPMIGVASTIMATVPVWVIPWMWIVYGIRPRAGQVLGSLAAVAGVGLLFY